MAVARRPCVTTSLSSFQSFRSSPSLICRGSWKLTYLRVSYRETHCPTWNSKYKRINTHLDSTLASFWFDPLRARTDTTFQFPLEPAIEAPTQPSFPSWSPQPKNRPSHAEFCGAPARCSNRARALTANPNQKKAKLSPFVFRQSIPIQIFLPPFEQSVSGASQHAPYPVNTWPFRLSDKANKNRFLASHSWAHQTRSSAAPQPGFCDNHLPQSLLRSTPDPV